MFDKLFPRKTLFFDLFEKHAAITFEAAQELFNCCSSENVLPTCNRIKDLEHEADTITLQCVEALHKTFITPIDRDQIFRLIGGMDDIIDSLDHAAVYVKIYKIHKASTAFLDLANILIKATKEVQIAVKGLRFLKQSQSIRKNCAEIRRLESDADHILSISLQRLFEEEQDACQIIKWKDLYESLESASDRCEDVADTIEGILLENN